MPNPLPENLSTLKRMVADTPTRPPLGDVAHIGHAQLFTPTPAATVAFFTDFLGLTVSGQDGESTYLRTWDDSSTTASSSPSAPHPASDVRHCAARPRRRWSAGSMRSRPPGFTVSGRMTSRASGRCG